MTKEEIKELPTADLQDRLVAMVHDYKSLKAQHAVSPIDSPSRLTADRRMIARVKTELRLRELRDNQTK